MSDQAPTKRASWCERTSHAVQSMTTSTSFVCKPSQSECTICIFNQFFLYSYAYAWLVAQWSSCTLAMHGTNREGRQIANEDGEINKCLWRLVLLQDERNVCLLKDCLDWSAAELGFAPPATLLTVFRQVLNPCLLWRGSHSHCFSYFPTQTNLVTFV